jgi:hypothetical protein
MTNNSPESVVSSDTVRLGQVDLKTDEASSKEIHLWLVFTTVWQPKEK